MDYSELLRHVDHTLLTPTATWDQVKTVVTRASPAALPPSASRPAM